MIIMYETIKQYSENAYLSKSALAKRFSGVELDALWKEILTYRALFQEQIVCYGKTYVLTMNPFVYRKLLLLIERFYQSESIAVISEHELWHHFYLRFKDTLDPYHLRLLCEERNCLLLRLYFCLCFSKKTALPLFEQMLAYHQCHHFLSCKESEADLLFHEEDGNDLTYGLLRFLEFVRLHLSERVVSYSHEQNAGRSLMTLKECWPQLGEAQLRFYLSHQKAGHYYTIHDYMEQQKVCYETARQAMEGLCTARFYRKQKIGKRFVYCL